MKAITNWDQLKEKLQEAESKQSVSDDLFRESLLSWYLLPTLFGEVPQDPESDEYKAYQLALYQALTDKAYDVSHEETSFDFERELQWPYPYSTKSAATVGDHLIGYGWLIKMMNLAERARILEIGSGYGALTSHLARMGYQVTCLDISASLLKYVQARTADYPTPVTTICGDMATVSFEQTYDAVIFNASLHHSIQFRTVLQRIQQALEPGGVLVFVAEPVVAPTSKVVPYPWGVRLDGMSIWAIRQWGWMELGFQEPYFVKMLNEEGWRLKRHNLGIAGSSDVWLAQRGRGNSLSGSRVSEYDLDLESEVIHLRRLVAAYENGRFIRLMKWLQKWR